MSTILDALRKAQAKPEDDEAIAEPVSEAGTETPGSYQPYPAGELSSFDDPMPTDRLIGFSAKRPNPILALGAGVLGLGLGVAAARVVADNLRFNGSGEAKVRIAEHRSTAPAPPSTDTKKSEAVADKRVLKESRVRSSAALKVERPPAPSPAPAAPDPAAKTPPVAPAAPSEPAAVPPVDAIAPAVPPTGVVPSTPAPPAPPAALAVQQEAATPGAVPQPATPPVPVAAPPPAVAAAPVVVRPGIPVNGHAAAAAPPAALGAVPAPAGVAPAPGAIAMQPTPAPLPGPAALRNLPAGIPAEPVRTAAIDPPTAVPGAVAPPPVMPEPSAGAVLETVPSGAPEVSLLFIKWSRSVQGRVASLRGPGGKLMLVHEGDIVEGMRVSTIRADAVELQWRGTNFLLFAAR